MRSRLGITMFVVALSIAGGVLMTTSASGKQVLHVVFDLNDRRVSVVDLHRDGLRLGDRIAARGALWDESQEDRVGTGYLQCLVHERILDPDQGVWNCNYVLKLADGEIMLQGMDPRGPGDYEIAVLGGTGAYAGASGDSTFTDFGADGSEYTDIVMRLSD